jgi:hypothetical protein
MARGQHESLGPIRERIGRRADRYELPRDLIFEDEPSASGAPTIKPGGAVEALLNRK